MPANPCGSLGFEVMKPWIEHKRAEMACFVRDRLARGCLPGIIVLC